MSSHVVAYYVMPSFLSIFVELIGIGAAVALYVSHCRARTETDRYVVSPKYNPQLKTPKLSFIPGTLIAATTFAVMVAQSTWQAHLSSTLTFISNALVWLCMAGLIGSVILLVVTSRPIETHPAHHTDEVPTEE